MAEDPRYGVERILDIREQRALKKAKKRTSLQNLTTPVNGDDISLRRLAVRWVLRNKVARKISWLSELCYFGILINGFTTDMFDSSVIVKIITILLMVAEIAIGRFYISAPFVRTTETSDYFLSFLSLSMAMVCSYKMRKLFEHSAPMNWLRMYSPVAIVFGILLQMVCEVSHKRIPGNIIVKSLETLSSEEPDTSDTPREDVRSSTENQARNKPKTHANRRKPQNTRKR